MADVVHQMKMEENKAIAMDLFKRVQASFPHLAMTLDPEPQNVDLELNVPVQQGVTVALNANLQHDELHMVAAHFWLEWFPCHEKFIQETFLNAVCGFLSGKMRILEHHRGDRVVKAELQEPRGNGWKTIGTWSTMHWPFPWRITIKEIRNAQPAGGAYGSPAAGEPSAHP